MAEGGALHDRANQGNHAPVASPDTNGSRHRTSAQIASGSSKLMARTGTAQFLCRRARLGAPSWADVVRGVAVAREIFLDSPDDGINADIEC
jgi:hypothetical protein